MFSRPVAEKAQYLPNEYVNFRIQEPGFSIIPNTIRISCVPSFEHDGGDLADTDVVYHDNDVGFEGLFGGITVKLNGRTIESITDYPRMRKAIIAGNKTEEGVAGESDGACRGSSGAIGLITRDKMLPANNPNCSFVPDICLNKASQPIASTKGLIEVSLRLEQANRFFWGDEADATSTYTISDLILEYRVTPTLPAHNAPLVMTVMNSFRQTLDTSNNQISTTLPVPTNKVFATLINQADSLDPTFNYLEMQNPSEGIQSVEWSINDSMRFEKFPFENNMEILYNYLMAVNGLNNGLNSLTLGQLEDSRKFGLGFSYYTYWAMGSRFAVNIQLNTAPVAGPYFIYMYFAGVIEV
jgi:hypothetical protein